MRPLLRAPSHPLALARFGLPTLLPGSAFARLFATEKGRALFGGVAAHAFRPLHQPLTSAIGVGIITAGHRYGWPVAAGGSGSITAALAALLTDLGGKIETGARVTVASPAARGGRDVVRPRPGARSLTCSATRCPREWPGRSAGSAMRRERSRSTSRSRAACRGRTPTCGRAGTVHLGGSYAEIAATERQINTGRMPERPFVLVGQQYLADPHAVGRRTSTRSTATRTCRTATTGMPPRRSSRRSSGSRPGSASGSLGQASYGPACFAAANPNFVGGDIITGAKDVRQLVFGPRTTLSPYHLGIPGMYLCSAATPPGPGVHGMCGANAAAEALRYLHREKG